MDLQEWRAQRAQGEDATLPSGLEVQLRRVDVLDLAARGEIPQVLQALMADSLKTGGKMTSDVDLGEVSKMLDVVAGAALAGPVGLDVAELPFLDKMAIFQWAAEGAAKLQPFRRAQAQPVESTPAGQRVRRKAK